MVNTLELRAEIVRNGYTIASLAKQLGITKNTLCLKVNGQSAFTVPEVQKLCELLHITEASRKVDIFLPPLSQ